MTTTTETATAADVNFYFDPVCPFAWMTSKWLRMVTAQRNYTVEWKFISLRLINAEVDYDTHFPPGYGDGHTAGLVAPILAEVDLADALTTPHWTRRSAPRPTRPWP